MHGTASANPMMGDYEALCGANRWRPINVFHEDDSRIVFVFHDGVEQLGRFLDCFAFEKPALVVFTCAWYVSVERAASYKRMVEQAVAGVNRARVSEQAILFVANSDAEADNLRSAFPPEQVARSNNAMTLNEYLFKPNGAEKTYDAVLNGKALSFKRHDLTADVANKAFISYVPAHAGDNVVDIAKFGPQKTYWSITAEQVVDVLNRSRVALALSATEGACWASLEYLLCGLPVVSTPSRGGRDDFYSETTAVIVEPSRSGVERGVAAALAKLRTGEFDAARIRRETLAKVEALRRSFETELNRFCAMNDLGGVPEGILGAYARKTSKLTDRWIYWPLDFRIAPGPNARAPAAI